MQTARTWVQWRYNSTCKFSVKGRDRWSWLSQEGFFIVANQSISGLAACTCHRVKEGHFQLSFVQNAIINHCITYTRGSSVIRASLGNSRSPMLHLWLFSTTTHHFYLKSHVRPFMYRQEDDLWRVCNLNIWLTKDERNKYDVHISQLRKWGTER